MKNLKLKLLAGLLGLSSIGMAQAATETATMEVSTTVTASCTVTATNMAFAAFSQAVGEETATASITPTCTKGTSYTVSVDSGLNGGGTARKMKHATDAAELLTYDLFKDDGVTAIGLSTADFSATGDGFGGADQTISIQGKLDTYQRVITGAYSDTLTVTVTY